MKTSEYNLHENLRILMLYMCNIIIMIMYIHMQTLGDFVFIMDNSQHYIIKCRCEYLDQF